MQVETVEDRVQRLMVIAQEIGKREPDGKTLTAEESSEMLAIGVALLGGFLANIARIAQAEEARIKIFRDSVASRNEDRPNPGVGESEKLLSRLVDAAEAISLNTRPQGG